MIGQLFADHLALGLAGPVVDALGAGDQAGAFRQVGCGLARDLTGGLRRGDEQNDFGIFQRRFHVRRGGEAFGQPGIAEIGLIAVLEGNFLAGGGVAAPQAHIMALADESGCERGPPGAGAEYADSRHGSRSFASGLGVRIRLVQIRSIT